MLRQELSGTARLSSLVLEHEVVIHGVASQMSPSVPFDNEHCLIVNAVLFADLSQMFIFL